MKITRTFCIVLFIFLITFFSCNRYQGSDSIIVRGNVIYDFRFADLAVKFIESGDNSYITEIAELEATEHLINHARRYNYNVPKDSRQELVSYLLTPFLDNDSILELVKRNILFAKDSIAKTDLPQSICKQYIPKDFIFSSSLFFTWGYNLGVAFGKNASLNLAHPHYVKNIEEIKYYAIHELHHAGFITLKNELMPSLDIKTFAEMAELIEYFTHMEGMATFAAYDIRAVDNALIDDMDYVVLLDKELMEKFEKKFFEIYFYFKNNPETTISTEDWSKLGVLSNDKRLWYRVGAKIAADIDEKLGREELNNLISLPSEQYIETYLKLQFYKE